MGYGGKTVDAELAELCEKLVSLEQLTCQKSEERLRRQRQGSTPREDNEAEQAIRFLCRLHGAVRARMDALNCFTPDLRVLKGTIRFVGDPCIREELQAYIQTVESGRADNGIPPIPIRGPGVPVDEGFPGLPSPSPAPGQPISSVEITPEAVINASIADLYQKFFELKRRVVLAGGGGGGTADVRIVENVTPLIGGTDTRVLFNDGGFVGEDAAFSWDETNNRLTIDQLALVDDNAILLTNQTDAAAAGAGTLTNAPIAGDPTWIRVVRNGVNGAMPWWRIP